MLTVARIALAWLLLTGLAYADGTFGVGADGLTFAVTNGIGKKGSGGGGGGGATGYTWSGPSSGGTGVASTNFTVTATGGAFTGAQTITIADGSEGGTITPSIGSPGTSTVTVTPTAASSSFTFTYTPVVIATVTLTGTNGQSWSNPSALTYAAYAGPGDIVSTSPKFWYGLRAYSLADRGNNLINLCEPTNTTCIDVASSATTGKLVAPTNVGGTDCTAVNTCTIKTLYNRASTNLCNSTNCDVTQSTAASRLTLTYNCLNGVPCGVSAGSATYSSAQALTTTITQQITVAGMILRTNTGPGPIFTNAAANVTLGPRNASANTHFLNAGTVATVGNITDGSWHFDQGIFNASSSILNCTGSAGTSCSTSGHQTASLAAGSTSIVSTNTISIITSLTGSWAESGVWATGFTTPQQTSMSANAVSYYGSF